MLLIIVSCQQGNRQPEKGVKESDTTRIVEATIKIGGMHCDMCTASIEKGVNELEGIQSVKASLEDSCAVVAFDAKKTDLSKIEKAIERRGYTVKKE